jgi:Starch binding domain
MVRSAIPRHRAFADMHDIVCKARLGTSIGDVACGTSDRACGREVRPHLLSVTRMSVGRRDWGLREGEEICITGALPQLGSWQQGQALTMTEDDKPFWEAEVRSPSRTSA